MRKRSDNPAVPASLVSEIDQALAVVDARRADLDRIIESRAPLLDRRHAHADLRAAFETADELLRAATRSAKAHSFGEGSRWRHRLSQLDTARQQHLFEESDDSGVLRIGSVRAIDTGMSGPALGDLLHGKSKPPGARAQYGLDREAILTAQPTPTPSAEIIELTPVRDDPTVVGDQPERDAS